MDLGNDCAGKLLENGIVALTIQITSYNDGTTNGYFTFPFRPTIKNTCCMATKS